METIGHAYEAEKKALNKIVEKQSFTNGPIILKLFGPIILNFWGPSSLIFWPIILNFVLSVILQEG